MPVSRWTVVTRIGLYACSAIGALGAAVTVDYAIKYVVDVANPLRQEYAIGAGFAVLYSCAFWVSAPLIAIAARRQLGRLERLAAYVPLTVGVAALVLGELAAAAFAH